MFQNVLDINFSGMTVESKKMVELATHNSDRCSSLPAFHAPPLILGMKLVGSWSPEEQNQRGPYKSLLVVKSVHCC